MTWWKKYTWHYACARGQKRRHFQAKRSKHSGVVGGWVWVKFSLKKVFTTAVVYFYGRGYWPEPFRSIIPYWPELFRSINPYWPEQFRSIKPYWPEPFKLMVPCERVEKALKLWTLSKTPFPTMLYIKCLDSLDLSFLFEHPMRRANTLCNNNL